MIEKLFLLKWLDRAPAWIGHLYSLFLVVIGWTIFAQTDMGQLGSYLKVMFGVGATAGNVIEAIFGSIMFEENRMFNPDIKRVLNSKKVTDHHAIIPTMEIAKADLAALP